METKLMKKDWPQILVRVDRETRKELRRIAADKDESLQVIVYGILLEYLRGIQSKNST